MASITSTGLGSGMDINGLVTKLMEAERTPVVTRLDKAEAKIQAKISALGTFKSSLSSVRDSLSALGKLQTFQKVNATSSDTGLLTATAGVNADPGSYKLEVQTLAQNHALSTKAYDSANAVVGTGTLTIKFGTTQYDANSDTYQGFTQNPDKGTLTLNIDSSNNTLTGIRDSINKVAAGVTASIVYNGSGYQLVLNSSDSGAKNSMQISVTDTMDSSNTDDAGLSVLAFNQDVTHLTQNQTAQDAKLLINGLAVSSSTNTIGDALKGVTLNLQQAQVGKTITLAVSKSDTDISSALGNFVGKFNELVKNVNAAASYDTQTRSAGVLLGESSVINTMSRLRAEISKSVSGLSGGIRNLSDIGITTQKDGTLNFDTSKLSKAYATDPHSVTALFAVVGRPTDSSSVYVSSTKDTVAGRYSVNIAQPATQGLLTGLSATGPFVIGSDNDTFRIKVNGLESGEIALTQGNYASGNELAAELQSRINGDNSLKSGNASVRVSYVNNQFRIQSNDYGSSSSVEITQVDIRSTTTLGLQVMVGESGRDVAGNISDQADARAVLTGSSIASLVVDADNDTFRIKVEGVESGSINLTRTTYGSGYALAAEIQTQIDQDLTLKSAGVGVEVAYVNNRIQIQSRRSGESSQLEITQVDTSMASSVGLGVAKGTVTIPPATQGFLVGDRVTTTIFPVNIGATGNTLKIKVDGVASGNLVLPDATYDSGSNLATALESLINADSQLRASGASVKVGYMNDQFQIQSTRYGNDSLVEIAQIDSNTAETLGLRVSTGVAGTGLQGMGQVLTATTGNASGLSLLIDGSQAGSRGTVDFTRGLVEQLNTILGSSLDGTGTLAVRTKGLNTSITEITRQRTSLSKRMDGYQAQLYTKFNAMDSIVGKLQATSTYLTQQINALNTANKQN